MTAHYGHAKAALFVATLAAFAIAQPLYDLLSQNPAFLTAHHATPQDVLLLIAGLSVAVPLLLILLQLLARVGGERTWRLVHAALIIGLISLLAVPLLNRLGGLPDVVTLCIALALGAAYYLALRKRPQVQRLTALAGIGIVVFPMLFALNPRVQGFISPESSATTLPQVAATAPVIVLVLDELPLTSLLDENRNIDRYRYPNFARLADTATWYRNAITISDDTVSGAVPAIVTGRYPAEDVNYRESRESLFTLLGGSYALNVTETYTRICPRDLCPTPTLTGERRRQLLKDLRVVFGHIVLPNGLRTSLPDISQGWKNFEHQGLSKSEQRAQRLDKLWDSRTAWLDQLIDTAGPTSRPTLHYLHVLLPHLPWTFLPNGNEYVLDARGLYGVPGVVKERWGDDAWAIAQGYQRHLLQLGFVDRKIGQLLDALEDNALLDDTLIVLTADHGVSFRANDGRRPLTNTNAADILRIPLFIKAPGQEAGVISDAPVETVDILPTVAALLGIELPWTVDGLRASHPDVAARQTGRVYQQNRRSQTVGTNISRAGLEAMDNGLERKLTLFGSGDDPKLFELGQQAKLVGTKLLEIDTRASDEQSTQVSVDPVQTGNGAPWAIIGKLFRDARPASEPYLAAAVDGIVCATTRSYANSASESAFVFFVGPRCDLDANDDVEIFFIDDSPPDPTLFRLNKRVTN